MNPLGEHDTLDTDGDGEDIGAIESVLDAFKIGAVDAISGLERSAARIKAREEATQ